MNFTIYTTGDATFLEEVLNAVAMVSGSGHIAKVAATGALISALLLGFRSIMEGGRSIKFEELILGFIVYMVAFYPTTTVLIEDGYTGNVHPVDNVPIGVGATGFIASSIGYKLTTMFETGYRYNSHGSSESLHRFAEPLQLLMTLRSSSANPLLMNAWNSQLGPYADIRRSWENYYNHCTLSMVGLGLVTPDQIIHGDAIEVTRFDSKIYGTQIFLGNQGGQEVTCDDGHDLLRQAMAMGMVPGSTADAVLKSLITKGMDDDWGAGQSAIDKLAAASSPILGYSTDVQKYVQASILEPIFQDAVESKYIDMLDVASAIAFRQSLQQRNTQWAQEQSAFMTVIRPAMTFFEGFVYAITPMMAMLFVMGRFGISLAGKYLQIIFWVQLWLPILSICNLYIRNAAEKQIQQTFVSSGAGLVMNFESFYMVNNIPEIVESWLATGSMLAASTPMLAFFLITGSSYAFTNIAGRLGGQDHFNEKLVTPDAASVGPANAISAFSTGSAGKGMQTSGSEGYVPSASISSDYKNLVSSSSQNVETASQGFTNSLNTALTSTTGKGNEFTAANGLQKQGAFNFKNTSGINHAAAEEVASNIGVSSDIVKGQMTSIAATAKMGGKTPGPVYIGAEIAASAGLNWSQSEKKSAGESVLKAYRASSTDDMQASVGEQIVNSFTQQGSEKFVSGINHQQATALNESAGKLKAAQQSHTKMTSNSEGFSDTQKFASNEVGALMHRTGTGPQLAAIMGDNPEMRADANQRADTYQTEAFGFSEPVARIAGMWDTIRQNGTQDQKFEALSLLSKSASNTMPSAPLVDNSGMPTVDPSSINKNKIGGLPGVAEKSQQVPEKADVHGLYSQAASNMGGVTHSNAAKEGANRILDDLYDNGPSFPETMAADKPMGDYSRASMNGKLVEGVQRGLQGEDLYRHAHFSGAHESGRTSHFMSQLAPHLTPAQSNFLAEVRLGGNQPTHVAEKYEDMRREVAETGPDGNIMTENGKAVLSPRNEEMVKKVASVLSAHQGTTEVSAQTDVAAVGHVSNVLGWGSGNNYGNGDMDENFNYVREQSGLQPIQTSAAKPTENYSAQLAQFNSENGIGSTGDNPGDLGGKDLKPPPIPRSK